jgi:hypothetical protein
LFDNNNDTIFVISYRPRRNKIFDGLKGVLNINSNKYAVQSVKAEPYNQNESVNVEINQKYEFIQNKQWFPVQLNTNIIFKNIDVTTNDTESFNLIGIGKSYIKNIKINPDIKSKDFNHIAYELDEKAGKQTSNFWLNYRDTLTAKEQKTYTVIDSIGEELKFDKKLNTYSKILSGFIPVKFIDIDLSKLMNYNNFEGFRLGLGAKTNEKLNSKISFNGYFRYGFSDKQWKYGTGLFFNINTKHQITIKVNYFNETNESATFSFLDRNTGLFGPNYNEGFRDFLIKDMYYTQGLNFLYTQRIIKFLKLELFTSYSDDYTSNNYFFEEKITNYETSISAHKTLYTNHEVGIKLRYAYNEQFALMNSKLVSLGTKYPVIYFNYIKGIDNLGGDFNYTKYELQIEKKFTIRNAGKTSILINAGYTNDELPYIYLYNGHGSYSNFGIETANSFGTMRMNEFLSDEFINLFIRHDFKGLLFKIKWFQPKIGIVSNFSYGQLKHNNKHKELEFNTLKKGFAESGIIINNIFKQNFSSYGFAIYYRWGPYSFTDISSNFAFKLSFYYSL